jgi:hypothetical protein
MITPQHFISRMLLQWNGITCSDDGEKVYAVAYNGPLYRSLDYGVTWTVHYSPEQAWSSISCDFTCSYVIASAGYSSIDTTGLGSLYRYYDLIDSVWTETTASSESYSFVASSASGQDMYAAVYNGYVYASHDFGATWSASSTTVDEWVTITVDDSGYRVAVGAGGYSQIGSIYISSDAGGSWQDSGAGLKQWTSLSSNADGTRVLGSGYYDLLYLGTELYGSIAPSTVPSHFPSHEPFTVPSHFPSHEPSAVDTARVPSHFPSYAPSGSNDRKADDDSESGGLLTITLDMHYGSIIAVLLALGAGYCTSGYIYHLRQKCTNKACVLVNISWKTFVLNAPLSAVALCSHVLTTIHLLDGNSRNEALGVVYAFCITIEGTLALIICAGGLFGIACSERFYLCPYMKTTALNLKPREFAIVALFALVGVKNVVFLPWKSTKFSKRSGGILTFSYLRW